MDNEYFIAQDQAGNTHRVHVNHRAGADAAATDQRSLPQYMLGDGSPVKRIDNDTFQVAGTGAFITIVRE